MVGSEHLFEKEGWECYLWARGLTSAVVLTFCRQITKAIQLNTHGLGSNFVPAADDTDMGRIAFLACRIKM